MLTMWDGHFKAILSRNHFAFESSDALKSVLSQVVKLDYHAVLLHFLLLWSQRSTNLLVLHFWKSKDGSLHSVNFERAWNELIDLWLPNFTEQENFTSITFLVRIKPEERERAIVIEFEWILCIFELGVSLILTSVLFILHFDIFPIFFDGAFFGGGSSSGSNWGWFD